MQFLPLPCNELNKEVQQLSQVERVIITAPKLCHRNHDVEAIMVCNFVAFTPEPFWC